MMIKMADRSFKNSVDIEDFIALMTSLGLIGNEKPNLIDQEDSEDIEQKKIASI